jgi:dipeptidyl aminopeptidase/acylaminoacyl peptidase
MLRYFLFLLFIPVALPSIAQKRPFIFEDMMKLKRVEEPVVSPDGKWVLFAAVDVDLAANTKTPHVWVVPLDSHISQNQGDVGHPKERMIISDQDADRPRWSPDGKRFAFVSTKVGGSQIWIAEFDRTTGTVTARHMHTNIATEADGELWSPDGKNILFKSDVYPECDGTPAEEAACNAKKLEDAKNSKVKAQTFTHLLYRHWNAYKRGKRTHLFLIPAEFPDSPSQPGVPHDNLRRVPPPRDLTPGDYDAPVFSLGGQDDYAFSPDGQEICYASNHDKDEAISPNNDLFTVPVSGGAAKNITAENKAADNTPLYSPDGKYIAYRAQARPGNESDRWRLMLYDRNMREKKNLTETFAGWAGTFIWLPDSSRIYLTSENAGISPVWAVYPATPEVKALLVGENAAGYSDDLAITNDGKVLLFTRMSVKAPNEIYAFGANLRVVAVTRLNEGVLSQISMSPLEPFWFSGAHEDKVQGFLVRPPNFDPSKKYPVKFIVHGGPEVPMGDEWSYRWNQKLFAASGYVVIWINFHGSPGYGQKFIDAINGDWGGAPFEDLMKGLDYAEQHYPFIDKDRECALGASYGGYMVNWILGHTNRFKCLVSHDGMFNTDSAWGTTEELWFNEWEFKGTPYTNREMYRKWSPHLYATNFKTPTLVVHGQLDYRLDVSEGFQLFTTLQRLGVPSQMLYFPDEGHWVLKPQNSQLWYKTVNEWVDRWIGK